MLVRLVCTGKASVPTRFKYKGQEGIIQAVEGIKIKSTKGKYYERIFAFKYRSETDIFGLKYRF